MKKVLYFIIGCIVFGVGMGMVIGTMPAFEMLGSSFLLNIKQGNFQQAYSTFSPECQQRLPMRNFVLFANKYQLNTYKEVKWLKTVTNKDKSSGYILGDIKINDKEVLPIEMQFVKLKTEGFQGYGWFVDDIFVGKEVILRQSRMGNTPVQETKPHPLEQFIEPVTPAPTSPEAGTPTPQ